MTPLRDRSWCHTVAYSSAILAGAAIARELTGGGAADGGAILSAALAQRARIEQLAAHIQGASRILSVGLGADLTTARELALKIEEGARDPRHGAPARIAPARPPGRLRRRHDGARALRLRRPLGPARRLPPAVGGRALPRDRHPDGRDRRRERARGAARNVERLRCRPRGRRAPERPAGGAVALQLLTLSLAHLVGSNPDLIRREQAPYREAAGEAETRADW